MRNLDKSEALLELARLHNACSPSRLKKLSKMILVDARKERDRVILAKGVVGPNGQPLQVSPEQTKMGVIQRQDLNDDYALFALFAKHPHTGDLHFKFDVVKMVYVVGKPTTVPVGGTEGTVPKDAVDLGLDDAVTQIIIGTVESVIAALAETVEGGKDILGDGQVQGADSGSVLPFPEGQGDPEDEGDCEPDQEAEGGDHPGEQD